MTLRDDWTTQCTHDDRHLLEDIFSSKDLAAYERFVFDYNPDHPKAGRRGIELVNIAASG